jgi:tRNA(Ile)-lysidine synthetase-like protein
MRKTKSKGKSESVGRSELARRFAQELEVRRIAAGVRIGVAVSGGADSVGLLRLLVELRGRLGLVLSVVHFNHQLRAKASDGDEAFVGKLAARYGLAFLVAREAVAARAERERGNLEDVARRSRYAYFERLVFEGQVDRVAVAHTADDQAETVLAHLLRGTGIAGLGGIHPEAGAVFRPLLKWRRTELREYLRGLGQSWREDATNRDETRTRARIRRKLIPFLEKDFQAAVVEHLCQLAELAREDEAWLEAAAAERVLRCVKREKDGWRIGIGDLGGVGGPRGLKPDWSPGLNVGAEAPTYKDSEETQDPPSETEGEAPTPTHNAGGPASLAVGRRMVRVLVRMVKPRAGQLGSGHVDSVLRLARGLDSGKCLPLPGGVEVRRERNALCFRRTGSPRDAEVDSSARPFAYAVDLSGGEAELRAVEHLWVLRFRVIDWPVQGVETKHTGAYLDREKLRLPLVVRNWRPGDAVQPLGHQKRHKLSRLLNEVGVNRWEKASWPVLTSDGKIVWCRGLPVAAEFAVSESTREGVVITEAPLT